MPASRLDPDCEKCPRLAEFLQSVRTQYPRYHGRPVGCFGDHRKGRLLIVGLAPGMHGANATGRPFTGDYAGILLYRTLFQFGFSNRPESVSADDGLTLSGVLITNAVKCLPPKNKPLGSEISNCNAYLRAELDYLPDKIVILALGRIAHQAVIKAFDVKERQFPFTHGQVHKLSGQRTLVNCYHCSRYNIQTKRLTADMFTEVFQTITKLLE